MVATTTTTTSNEEQTKHNSDKTLTQHEQSDLNAPQSIEASSNNTSPDANVSAGDEELKVNPSDVILLEGILIFHDARIGDLMNMKIFVDTDADVRLARRIRRDTAEKNRDINMYSKFVKPAFDDFILPTKKYADIIIPR